MSHRQPCQSGTSGSLEWAGSGGSTEGLYGYFDTATCPDGWIKADNATGQTVDARGRFIRAWDDGRGIDPGRGVGSYQGDAIRNITGRFTHGKAWSSGSSNGAFRSGGSYYAPYGNRSGNGGWTNFNAARVVPTANENRPTNIALNVCKQVG